MGSGCLVVDELQAIFSRGVIADTHSDKERPEVVVEGRTTDSSSVSIMVLIVVDVHKVKPNSSAQ